MMTHVYQQDERIIAAAKGAAERILAVCQLKTKEKLRLLALVKQLASQGFRVIGVALAESAGLPFPKTQDGFDWQFSGLIALYDPPRPEALSVVQQLQKAGIQVKLLTGDYLETAEHIANKTGVPLTERSYTGSEILQMSPEEVQQAVQTSHLFSRMFPEAKLKVIEALKANHEIVAMTGDGVNDGPALKAAHIGIALGKKGTEIARQSADLIITDDDLRKIPEAIQQGRKIFSNLKKALRYIISIHIPILLTASLPLVLHWKYPTLFEPIHVIFLELIMGPTCSIFFEREPAEPGLMLQRPRPRIKQLYTKKEVYLSVLQGILITAGVLTLYYYTQNNSITYTRTIVFTTLICSNIFLTFTNRSFEATIYETMRYRNNLALPLLLLSTVFLTTILTIAPLRQLFALQPISMSDFGICLLTAFVCVFWFEGYKYVANRPGDHTHRTD
jgi:Ca2+-transporting ATPase